MRITREEFKILREKSSARRKLHSTCDENLFNGTEQKLHPGVLEKIHLDHQYMAICGGHSNSSFYENDKDRHDSSHGSKGIPTQIVDGIYNQEHSTSNEISRILSASSDRLRTLLTDEKVGNLPENNIHDNEVMNFQIPNAALIQKHFQAMLDMTSFQSIVSTDSHTDVSNNMNQDDNSKFDDNNCNEEYSNDGINVQFTDKKQLENNSEEQTENHENDQNEQNSLQFSASCTFCSTKGRILTNQRTSKSMSQLLLPESKHRKDWTSICRHSEDELHCDALLQQVLMLMVLRWAEYLALTPEQMYRFQLENSVTGNGSSNEVKDLLKNRDSHIWELLEDILQPETII